MHYPPTVQLGRSQAVLLSGTSATVCIPYCATARDNGIFISERAHGIRIRDSAAARHIEGALYRISLYPGQYEASVDGISIADSLPNRNQGERKAARCGGRGFRMQACRLLFTINLSRYLSIVAGEFGRRQLLVKYFSGVHFLTLVAVQPCSGCTLWNHS